MKYKLMTALILVGMFSLFVTAITLSPYVQEDKDLSQAIYDKFQEYDITGIQPSPIICIDENGDGNDDWCKAVKLEIKVGDRCVKCTSYNPEPSTTRCKTYEINPDGIEECVEFETYYYTNAELEAERDLKQSNVEVGAYNQLLKEESTNVETEIVAGADVTFTRGK